MALADRVVFEDNHHLVINKLPGELVQGDRTGDVSLVDQVKNYLAVKYQKPGDAFCGLVHRLDRPTSGLVVFARTSKALSRMNAIFEKRQIDKRYFAIVKSKPQPGQNEITHFLKRNRTKNKSYVVNASTKGAKEARLTYEGIGHSERYFLLQINLHTGRHHQIRAQLSYLNMPIKGDLKYGYPRSNPDASISLHAGLISFIHPVRKEELTLKAPQPKPDALWRLFNPLIIE
jgi:23S rRNA pseudouridine1911/1915/1917 synthase